MMTRKSIYKLISVIIIITILISFIECKRKEKDTIRIGAILPLTGQGSVLGKGYQNAMNLALQYIEERKLNEKKIEIIYEDSQSNSTFAVNSANKLIKVNRVDVLILANANIVESVTPVAIKENIPIIAITSTPNITKKSSLIYRIWLNEYGQIEKFADFIINKNYSKVGLLTINNEYGNEVYKLISNKLNDRIKFHMPYSSDALDVKNEVVKMKNMNLDCIYILGNPPEYITLIKKIREYGYEKEIFGTSALTVSFVRSQLGNLLEQTIFSGPSNLNDSMENSDVSDFFRYNFKKIYKTEPEWFYSFCFDQILFINNAIVKLERGEVASLNEGLKKIEHFQGVNGQIYIDEFGDASSEISLFTQKDGKIIKVQ